MGLPITRYRPDSRHLFGIEHSECPIGQTPTVFYLSTFSQCLPAFSCSCRCSRFDTCLGVVVVNVVVVVAAWVPWWGSVICCWLSAVTWVALLPAQRVGLDAGCRLARCSSSYVYTANRRRSTFRPSPSLTCPWAVIWWTDGMPFWQSLARSTTSSRRCVEPSCRRWLCCTSCTTRARTHSSTRVTVAEHTSRRATTAPCVTWVAPFWWNVITVTLFTMMPSGGILCHFDEMLSLCLSWCPLVELCVISMKCCHSVYHDAQWWNSVSFRWNVVTLFTMMPSGGILCHFDEMLSLCLPWCPVVEFCVILMKCCHSVYHDAQWWNSVSFWWNVVTLFTMMPSGGILCQWNVVTLFTMMPSDGILCHFDEMLSLCLPWCPVVEFCFILMKCCHSVYHDAQWWNSVSFWWNVVTLFTMMPSGGILCQWNVVTLFTMMPSDGILCHFDEMLSLCLPWCPVVEFCVILMKCCHSVYHDAQWWNSVSFWWNVVTLFTMMPSGGILCQWNVVTLFTMMPSGGILCHFDEMLSLCLPWCPVVEFCFILMKCCHSVYHDAQWWNSVSMKCCHSVYHDAQWWNSVSFLWNVVTLFTMMPSGGILCHFDEMLSLCLPWCPVVEFCFILMKCCHSVYHDAQWWNSVSMKCCHSVYHDAQWWNSVSMKCCHSVYHDAQWWNSVSF